MATDEELEAAILQLLQDRTGTICPSEVARSLGEDEDEDGWRRLMEPVRKAAQRLVEHGLVEITQRGRVVDLKSVRGPIRIRSTTS